MLAFVCADLNLLLTSDSCEQTFVTKQSPDVRTKEQKASQSAAIKWRCSRTRTSIGVQTELSAPGSESSHWTPNVCRSKRRPGYTAAPHLRLRDNSGPSPPCVALQ